MERGRVNPPRRTAPQPNATIPQYTEEVRAPPVGEAPSPYVSLAHQRNASLRSSRTAGRQGSRAGEELAPDRSAARPTPDLRRRLGVRPRLQRKHSERATAEIPKIETLAPNHSTRVQVSERYLEHGALRPPGRSPPNGSNRSARPRIHPALQFSLARWALQGTTTSSRNSSTSCVSRSRSTPHPARSSNAGPRLDPEGTRRPASLGWLDENRAGVLRVTDGTAAPKRELRHRRGLGVDCRRQGTRRTRRSERPAAPIVAPASTDVATTVGGDDVELVGPNDERTCRVRMPSTSTYASATLSSGGMVTAKQRRRRRHVEGDIPRGKLRESHPHERRPTRLPPSRRNAPPRRTLSRHRPLP